MSKLKLMQDGEKRPIYPVLITQLPRAPVTVALEVLEALAAKHNTPHFLHGSTHFTYLPYIGFITAEDGAATKSAGPHNQDVNTHSTADVKAAPSPEGLSMSELPCAADLARKKEGRL